MMLSTGKEVYANNGIIGIGADLDTIYEGYDGVMYERFPGIDGDEYWTKTLSKEEQIEIAELMIKRWMDFKSKVETE